MSEKTPNDHTDPTWRMHMQTLTKRMRTIEISQKIDQALFEWYSERGKEVPNWKREKDPQWWTNYLRELSGDYEENDDW
jgi:hypothetical protein